MKNKITVIGLCGRSGSGKGYVCKKLSSYGIPCISCDSIYHQLLEDSNSEMIHELYDFLGEQYFSPQKHLDRKSLSTFIYKNPSKLKLLNEITHKYILKSVKCMIDEYKKKGITTVIVDAPLLFESKFNEQCTYTVCVTCGDEISIKRIVSRDNIPLEIAKKRLDCQIGENELRKMCDFEIINNNITDLDSQIEKLLKNIKFSR